MYNTSKGAPVYQRKEKASADEKDEYEVIREKFDYVYPSDQCMFFPRIYEERDAAKYISWLSDVHYKTVNYTIPGQGTHQLEIPTQYDNLRYFLSYQLNFMYWRYFMWNFAGRQNDLQGLGETEHGNWITGFKFLDDLRLGNQDLLPTELKENKGHNVFYCLPLLLGIIGTFKDMPNRITVLLIAVGFLIFAFIYMCTIPLPTGFGQMNFFEFKK